MNPFPPSSNPRDLFLEALEKSAPAERAAFLDGACRSDGPLRAAVEDLLANHHDDSFLEDPAVSMPTVMMTPNEEVGEHIGRYKLLQEIGEGGFGTVWMAEQMEPVSRRVALKIIKLGMDTREVIARFEAERQALAMMDHPNIAKVLDAGATDKGRPFFVMELVKGVTITQFCDEQQLGTNERLALFSDVCAAINHAHQKGIIHRDIKPSNVMVTLHGDKAVVKVIDFGIAKATQGKLTEKTLFTRFEQFIGTPVYMSPEQAVTSGLDIDTRSDIYALGILLYELLTGKPPFDAQSLASAGYEEMRRIIREVEPVKPSSQLSTIAGAERDALAKARHIEPGKVRGMVEPDLDWIVMKAIEKDRARRYETANAFAQDIVRFLADEPVSARPPSAGYKFRKFARRNKAVLRVAAGIAAVLVFATAVSTWQAIRARNAEKLAFDRVAEVVAERDAKDLARKDAEDISRFLGKVFRSPDPSRDGRTITVAETLKIAASDVENDLSAQPAQRAKLQGTLGDTYRALGLYPLALPLLEKVRDYYRTTSGPEHPDTLMAMHNLARAYNDADRRDEALKLQEEVLTLRRKVLGPEHLDTLKAMNNLAISYETAGRREDALKLREEVLPLSRKANGPEHHFTFLAMTNLSASYSDTGRPAEAIKMMEEMLPLERKILGAEHPDTLRAMGNLATYYGAAGRSGESLKLREEVLVLRRKVLGPEHSETLIAMQGVAISYFDAGRRDEALKLREEVLAISRKVNGPEHPDTVTAKTWLAVSYSDVGRQEEALKLREDVLAFSLKMNGSEHPGTLTAMNDLAASYSDVGQKDAALKLREEVVALRSKVLGPEHPETLDAMTNLANSYSKMGRGDEGLKVMEEVLKLSRKVRGPEHPSTLMAMNNLALCCIDAGRRDEALKLQEEILPLRRKVLGPEHPDTIDAMSNLAGSYADADRQKEAIVLAEEALKLHRKVLGPAHIGTLRAMDNLADFYVYAGRWDDALKLREEVLPLSRTVRGPEHPNTLGDMTNLAISYREAGRLPEAVALQEQALAIKRRVLPPNHPYLGVALRNLRKLYEKTGRKDEAEALHKELADRGEETPPEPVPEPTVAPEIVVVEPVKPMPKKPPVPGTLIAPDSDWKWRHPTDGKDPAESTTGFHTAFFLPDFDDSAWKTGQDSDEPDGGFGYGLNFNGLSIGKPEGMKDRRTAYFRHAFTTDKPHSNLELRCRRDDGIIVYLDGKEILRDNTEAGPDAWMLSAKTPIGPGDDSVVQRFPVPGTLAAGKHLVAISVHNTAQPSTDLRLGGVTLLEVKPTSKGK